MGMRRDIADVQPSTGRIVEGATAYHGGAAPGEHARATGEPQGAVPDFNPQKARSDSVDKSGISTHLGIPMIHFSRARVSTVVPY